MLIQLRHLCFLVFIVGTMANTKGLYRMKLSDGYLTFNADGRMEKVRAFNKDITAFRDIPEGDNEIRVQVMTGPFAGRYLFAFGRLLVYETGQTEQIRNMQRMRWVGCQLHAIYPYGDKSPLSINEIDELHLGIYFNDNNYRENAKPLCITKQPLMCSATSVVGSWRYVQSIAGATKIRVKTGTNKRYEESRSNEWSHSVSASAAASFSIMTFAQVSVSVGYEYRNAAAQTFSNEWSTNEEREQEVSFDAADRGKALWQFITVIKDDCQHEENTLLPEYAVTKNKLFPPCCLPGYSDDNGGYAVCVGENSLIERGSSRCKVVNYTRRRISGPNSELFS